MCQCKLCNDIVKKEVMDRAICKIVRDEINCPAGCEGTIQSIKE